MKAVTFLILLNLVAAANAASGLRDCRSKISDLLCLVDPVEESNPFADRYSRPCLEGAKKYEALFTRHYDRSSPLIREMYCSLDKIWIENESLTTAYAVPIRDHSNILVAGAIGMSRKFLDEDPSLETWMTNKEASSFGGAKVFKYAVRMKKRLSAVDYALNHEFGHIFDYANDIQESWLPLSWESSSTTKEEYHFPLRRELCFYQCGGSYIAMDRSQELMEALTALPFVSSYATVNSKEDWAETFAIFLAVEEKGLAVKVRVNESTKDLNVHWQSERLRSKKEFFKRFKGSSIRYPGN